MGLKSWIQNLRKKDPKQGSEKKKEAKKAASDKPRLYKWVRITFVVLFWLFLLSPYMGLFGMLWVASKDDLPSTEELEDPQMLLASEVYSADGVLLGKYYSENRTYIGYNDISRHVFDCLIATEDERFYEHSGIDVKALGRVAEGVVKNDQSSGGGSTISQQLAKNLFKTRRKRYKDYDGVESNNETEESGAIGKILRLARYKFKEWLLALEIEKQYSKDEIATMYLNTFDFLYNAVGIHSASRVYFNTTPDSLRIEQAAMLVGMAKNPSLFNPMRDSTKAIQRRNIVLGQLVRNSENPAVQYPITQTEFDSLKQLPIGLDYRRVDHQEGPAPYFREVLRESVADTLANLFINEPLKMKRILNQWEYKDFEDSLIRIQESKLTLGERAVLEYDLYRTWAKYAIYNKGLRIYTTIDSRMQEHGEYAVREYLSKTLQPEFEKQNRRYLKDNYPFARDLDEADIEGLLRSAMKRSDRWHNMRKADFTDYEIEKSFQEEVPMKVFSWNGEIDTVMTPMDSIRYYKQFLQAGLMSMDPKTGYVKAWVGGIDFYHFKYDHVGKARRQVGSTFKPFVYATAIDLGKIKPCMEVPDIEHCVEIPYTSRRNKMWCPSNSGARYTGDMITMKKGLANSMNNITAWVMGQTGPKNVVKFVEALGLEKGYLNPVPSLALGVCDLSVYELVGAQASFANKGVYIRPIIITRIEDKNGNAIFESTPNYVEAYKEETAWLTLQMMRGVVDGGTSTMLRSQNKKASPWAGIPWSTQVAGKTGTTQEGSDGWFIGLTPDLVTGVWVGGEDRSVHFPNIIWGQGAKMGLPIFGYYMNKIYDDSRLKISTDPFEGPKDQLEIEFDCNQIEGDPDGEPGWGEEGEGWGA